MLTLVGKEKQEKKTGNHCLLLNLRKFSLKGKKAIFFTKKCQICCKALLFH